MKVGIDMGTTSEGTSASLDIEELLATFGQLGAGIDDDTGIFLWIGWKINRFKFFLIV